MNKLQRVTRCSYHFHNNNNHINQRDVFKMHVSVLRTPVGTGALQCTPWHSYLGVYCNGFEDGRPLVTRLSTLYTL